MGVLLLGGGDSDPVDGRLRRVLNASPRNPRELFKLLTRDLCAISGVEWHNRFIEGKAAFELAGTRISHDIARVYVDVETSNAIREVFGKR